MAPYTYDYPRPSVTTDVVFVAPARGAPEILLIRRRSAPYRRRWALPGGFLDMDEEVEAGARRELFEETGVEAGPLVPLGTYGALGRDPRRRTISITYLALSVTGRPRVAAGDDASEAAWHALDALPKLAFDHAGIIADARERLDLWARTPGGLAPLAGEGTTVAELRRAARALRGESGHSLRSASRGRRPVRRKNGAAPGRRRSARRSEEAK